MSPRGKHAWHGCIGNHCKRRRTAWPAAAVLCAQGCRTRARPQRWGATVLGWNFWARKRAGCTIERQLHPGQLWALLAKQNLRYSTAVFCLCLHGGYQRRTPHAAAIHAYRECFFRVANVFRQQCGGGATVNPVSKPSGGHRSPVGSQHLVSVAIVRGGMSGL